ncbi:MAG: FtsX-like permease family protein [Nitrospirae bacterium]|nr:FtsX-like permease family protein [Nitrospirota bacterium]
MRKFLGLVRLFVLRHMREEKFLTSLSVVGIALGIGLFTGVKVASDKAMASFDADIRGVARHANYEIADLSGIDFREEIYPAVRRIEENAFPFLTANGYLPAMKEGITIEGIYTPRAGVFLSLFSTGPGDMGNFYRDLNGVFITKKFSRNHSLKKGDVLDALVYNRRYQLRVAGVIGAERLPGNTVLMDLGNFQEYFGKAGYLSEIDLPASAREAGEIGKILPPNLAIEKKEEVIRNRQALLKSFRYNLQFVSLIAILVGIFLLYNTVFVSVVKRRTEIGILRGLGAGRNTVLLLFMVQGLAMGLAGSVLGIFLGQAAAYVSVLAVEKTVSAIYSPLSISDYVISGGEAAPAVFIGIVVSLIASALPAFESSRIRPNESMREGSFEGRYSTQRKVLSLLGLFCIAAGGFASYADYRLMPFEFPFLSYGGIVLIIAGFAFISPSYLSSVLKIAAAVPERVFGMTGKLSLGDISGNLYRFSVAVMSVAISGALIIALFTLIFSFRHSLIQWIHRNIAADVYIKAASCRANFCFFPLPGDVLKTVGTIPGVARIDRFRALSVDFHGRKVVAGFGLRETMARDNIAGISRYLAIRYGLKKGDAFTLETPKGRQTFVVGDVFNSYSTTSGFLYLDRKVLTKYWGLDDATQLGITLQKGVDADRFIGALKERLPGGYALEIMNNETLRRKVLAIFDRTFAITYAIELIAILVSLLGVINTLLALVLERKREISILRYLGCSWEQIRRLLLFAAGTVAASGILWGILLGSLMSVIFIDVINTLSFGWEIRFTVPALYLSAVMAALFLTTLAAAIIPSKVAKRTDPKRFISFE